MKKSFIIATLCSFIASVAVAQSTGDSSATEPTADAATLQAADQANETPSELSLGEETIQRGDRYLSETIGDWELRCIRIDGENDPCEMYQLLEDQDGNAVAEVSMFRLENAGRAVAGATIVAPLETLLTAQMSISVDGATVKRYPFAFCSQIGCAARIGLTQEDINAYKRGKSAKVSVVPAASPENVVTLQMSLTGFTASYNKATVAQR